MPDGTPDDTKKAFDELLNSILLNSALASIKAGGSQNARTAVSLTTRALNRQLSVTDKGKALYRRALGHLALNDEDQAEQDLVSAKEIVPQDESVEKELTKVRTLKKEKRDKEKAKYKKMFA